MTYWWRSRFSGLQFNELKLRMSIIFEIATNEPCAAGAPLRLKLMVPYPSFQGNIKLTESHAGMTEAFTRRPSGLRN
jgi:hypothetical protein